MAGSGGDMHYLGVPLDRHATSRQRVGEDGFDVGLADQQEMRECGVHKVELVELGTHHTEAEMEMRRRVDIAHREQRVGHPDGTEHLERPWMHDQCSG